MKSITEQFPPLPRKYLVESIKEFTRLSVNDKINFLSEILDTHPFLNFSYESGHRFRRARKIKEEFYPENIQDFLWRIEGEAKPGRANPGGFPVLYVADRIDTALTETRVESDTVLICELKVRSGTGCVVAIIGEIMNIQRKGTGYVLGSGEGVTLFNNMLNACDRECALSLLIADAFLYECMLNDDDHYLIPHTLQSLFSIKTSMSQQLLTLAFGSMEQLTLQLEQTIFGMHGL